MSLTRIRDIRFTSLVIAVVVAFTIAGCEGDDGAPGSDGVNGTAGSDGLHCWDLNANGVPDPEEDLNGDGVVDALGLQRNCGRRVRCRETARGLLHRE